MSFSDQPTLTGWQKLGCAVVAIIGIIVVSVGLGMAALGHCAPQADGTGCENDALIKFIAFPGTAILFFVIGILMMKYFMRDKN